MILERIRKRKIFLILMVGMALFAFVISGVFSQKNQHSTPNIGVINGEEIPYEAFRHQVEQTVNNMGHNEVSTNYVVNALWQQQVRNKILEQQLNKLGISVGKDQILTAISLSPIAQNPQFQNATGAFDANKFTQFIAGLKKTNPEGFKQWQQQEAQLVESAKQQMYLTLIRAGLGATNSEADKAYREEADKVSVKYVTLQYNSIPDEKIKISDKEIEDYVNKNKKSFEREASRGVQFVVVREEASKQDKKEIFDKVQALTTNSIRYNAESQKNDTINGFSKIAKTDLAEFVNKNSDIPFDSLYVSKDVLPAAVAEKLLALQEDEVFGPYEDNGYYKLSRLVNRNTNAQVKASHILISYKDAPRALETSLSKEEAKAKAEELLAEVKKPNADFTKLVTENSDDKSSPDGNLGFFQRGQMVKPFNDYVFSHKVGDIGLVETDFGFHIIKITDEKAGVQLATIAHKIEPSDKTRDEAFTKITKFEINATKNPAKFSAIAQKFGLQAVPSGNLLQDGEDIIGLGQNRSLVRWAFDENTKIGAIRRFELKDGYAVAQLNKKQEKGLASVSEARMLVEPILRKEKKAQILSEKMKGSSVEQIAQKVGKTAEMAELSVKNPALMGVGFEPKVVGEALATAVNKTSKPIKGDNGVYVIRVVKKEKALPLTNAASYSNVIRMLKMNRVSRDLFKALEETSEIEDNRNLFY